MSGFDYIKKNIDEIRKEIYVINKNVKLLGVTKTFSKEAVEAAIQFGLNEFGESKIQEAETKIELQYNLGSMNLEKAKYRKLKPRLPELKVHIAGYCGTLSGIYREIKSEKWLRT